MTVQAGKAFEAMVARFLRAHGFEVVDAPAILDESGKVDLLVKAPSGLRFMLQVTVERQEEVVLGRRPDGGLEDRPTDTSKLRRWAAAAMKGQSGHLARLLEKLGLAPWIGASSVFFYADGWFSAIRQRVEENGNSAELPTQLGRFLLEVLSHPAPEPVVAWHIRHAGKGAVVSPAVAEAALYQEVLRRRSWR